MTCHCGRYMRAVLNDEGETYAWKCDVCGFYDPIRSTFEMIEAKDFDPTHGKTRWEQWGILCPDNMDVRTYGTPDYTRVLHEAQKMDVTCKMGGRHLIVRVRKSQ